MNIQDEMQKIHHKFGVSEMANYKIEQFIDNLIKKDRKQQLILNGVVASLPTTNEAKLKLKQAVENSFKDNEVVEKREYSLGFRHCYNWLKIEQMKSKG